MEKQIEGEETKINRAGNTVHLRACLHCEKKPGHINNGLGSLKTKSGGGFREGVR